MGATGFQTKVKIPFDNNTRVCIVVAMIATGAMKSARKRRKRIAGIGRSAAALQVTRQHLGLVIRGGRVSKSLLARYETLTGDQAKAAKTRNRTKEAK